MSSSLSRLAVPVLLVSLGFNVWVACAGGAELMGQMACCAHDQQCAEQMSVARCCTTDRQADKQFVPAAKRQPDLMLAPSVVWSIPVDALSPPAWSASRAFKRSVHELPHAPTYLRTTVLLI